MDKPELLIFDLDGTLLDTLSTLAEAFNRALEDLECPTHPIVDYKTIIGDGVTVAAQRCLPVDRQGDIEAFIERYRYHYDENWHEAKPYDGIVPLLDRVKGDIPLAVLTNKDDKFSQQVIDHALPDTFDQVLGYREPFKHKPDPAGGKHLIEALGASPSNTWMIGDTATDMRTAVACNMVGVGVLWGFRDEKELIDSGAQHIVGSPKLLAQMIEETL